MLPVVSVLFKFFKSPLAFSILAHADYQVVSECLTHIVELAVRCFLFQTLFKFGCYLYVEAGHTAHFDVLLSKRSYVVMLVHQSLLPILLKHVLQLFVESFVE